MSDQQARDKLLYLRTWAQEKLRGGSEPPWAWYQYMKLVETIDAIIEGQDASRPIHMAVDNDKPKPTMPM